MYYLYPACGWGESDACFVWLLSLPFSVSLRVEEEEEPPSRPMSPNEQFNLMTYIERMEVGPLACERDFEVINPLYRS